MSHFTKKNAEVKVRCEDLSHISNELKSAGAIYIGLDHQIDTYFQVHNGYMKLREGNIENYLIYYEHDKSRSVRESNIILEKIHPHSNLKAILTKALEPLVVVCKHRKIYYKGHTKFHLDEVEDLGRFVEIEVSDPKTVFSVRMKQVLSYMGILGLDHENIVAESYSDLLLRKTDH